MGIDHAALRKGAATVLLPLASCAMPPTTAAAQATRPDSDVAQSIVRTFFADRKLPNAQRRPAASVERQLAPVLADVDFSIGLQSVRTAEDLGALIRVALAKQGGDAQQEVVTLRAPVSFSVRYRPNTGARRGLDFVGPDNRKNIVVCLPLGDKLEPQRLQSSRASSVPNQQIISEIKAGDKLTVVGRNGRSELYVDTDAIDFLLIGSSSDLLIRRDANLLYRPSLDLPAVAVEQYAASKRTNKDVAQLLGSARQLQALTPEFRKSVASTLVIWSSDANLPSETVAPVLVTTNVTIRSAFPSLTALVSPQWLALGWQYPIAGPWLKSAQTELDSRRILLDVTTLGAQIVDARPFLALLGSGVALLSLALVRHLGKRQAKGFEVVSTPKDTAE